MAIEPITTSGPSITVSTSDELMDAYRTLSNLSGGGTIVVAPGADPLKVYMYHPYTGGLGDEPVVIKSNDPQDPASFESIFLRNVNNIRFENIEMAETWADGRDLTIQGSDNIQIVDSHFYGSATGPALVADDKAGTLGMIRESTDIIFSNNTVDGYFSALGITNTTNIELNDNIIRHIQGDGMQLGGVQNVEINGNLFEDFYSAKNSIIHPDMIQIHGSGISQPTFNVEIVGNTFLNSEGGATQTIFIRNEAVRTDVTQDHQNFTISDNLIYNGSLNGISLADIDGLTLENNTLLWNPEAIVVGTEDSSQPPRIIVRDSVTDVVASGNIAQAIVLPDGTVASNNHTVNFNDPDAPNYVGNHFVNATLGGDLDLRDLRLLPDSEWVGAGAEISQPVATTNGGVEAVLRYSVQGSDIHEITFDALQSIDAKGYLTEAEYDFVWKFDDGVTLKGISVTRPFPDSGEYGVQLSVFKGGALQDQLARDVLVESKDIFEIDFEDGVVDLSDIGAKIVGPDQTSDAYVNGHDGQGFQLDGGDNGFYVHRDTGEINDLKAFGLSLDLRMDSPDGKGMFLNFYKVMTASITAEGAIKFTLNTDEGSFQLETGAGVMKAGEWHRIGIAYDDDAGSLGIYVDGEKAAETAASGETAGRAQNMTWGNVFGKPTAMATLDNIVMSKDPTVAGELTIRKSPMDDTPDGGETVVDDSGTIIPQTRADEDTAGGDTSGSDTSGGGAAGGESAGGDAGSDRTSGDTEGESDGAPGRVISRARDDGDNFIAKIIKMLLSIFGLGKDDDEETLAADDVVEERGEQQDVSALEDLVPVVGSWDDTMPDDDDDLDDDLDIAA